MRSAAVSADALFFREAWLFLLMSTDGLLFICVVLQLCRKFMFLQGGTCMLDASAEAGPNAYPFVISRALVSYTLCSSTFFEADLTVTIAPVLSICVLCLFAAEEGVVHATQLGYRTCLDNPVRLHGLQLVPRVARRCTAPNRRPSTPGYLRWPFGAELALGARVF